MVDFENISRRQIKHGKLPSMQSVNFNGGGGGGAQWLSGGVFDSRPRGGTFEPHQCHCNVVLEQDTVQVQPRNTRPYITERLLMGCKESNQTQTNKQTKLFYLSEIQNLCSMMEQNTR